jgi:L-arabinose isomerase
MSEAIQARPEKSKPEESRLKESEPGEPELGELRSESGEPEVIESFEVAKGNVFGDLLSKRSEPRVLKVGLVTVGFFEYWRMFPATFQEEVRSDMTLVYENLKRHVKHVVWPGLVHTLDTAEAAGRRLKEEQADLVVYVAGTYCPDYMAIQVLSHIREVPVLLFNTQGSNRVNLSGSYAHMMRNSGLIANTQLAATFRKMGWYPDLKVVVGAHKEEAAYSEIGAYVRAYDTYVGLQSLNIGVIGHVFRGMYDFEYDKTMIKGTLGPNVISIQVDHLLRQFREAADENIRDIVSATKSRFNIVGLGDDDIVRSAKFYYALRSTIERFRLDAVTLLGQHYTEEKTGTTPYLANTMLHEEGRYVVNTEGDVHGLIMMCIMNRLTGQTPAFAEWGEYDESLNAILMIHHGYANTDYATDCGAIKVNRSPEQWGLAGKGFGFEYTLKPGVVTLGHLINDAEGYKMLIVRGKALHVPNNIPCEEITALIQLESPVKSFLASLIKEGFAHHCIIAYGDLSEELSQIARFMKIRACVY